MGVDLEKLKQLKVTVPVVFLLGLIWLGWNAKELTVDTLGEFFLAKAVAEEQYQVIQESVKENRTLIVTHIQQYQLNENARETQAVSDQLYELQLFVQANGASDLTRDRERDLENRLQRLARVRACIIRNARLDDDEEPENCAAII